MTRRETMTSRRVAAPQPASQQELFLNYLPLRFTSDMFTGGTIIFDMDGGPDDEESPIAQRLKEMRAAHPNTYLFHRDGNKIYSVPLIAGHQPHGTPTEFHMLGDFQLANALAREALLRFFQDDQYTITDTHPLTLLLTNKNLAPAKPDVFGIFPQYELNVRPLAPHEGSITSGLLIKFGIRSYFLPTAATLQGAGIDLTGLHVCGTKAKHHPLVARLYTRFYLGRIEKVSGTVAELSDSDQPTVDLTTCYLDANPHTIELIAQQLLGAQAATFHQELFEQSYAVTGAEHQLQRLKKIGGWLADKSPLPCCPDMDVRIVATPHLCRQGTDAGDVRTLQVPSIFLRPGGSITVPWPVDREIDAHGPYDAESFPDKRARIAVVCPSEFRGEVEQFLGNLRDGFPSHSENAPFRQGFIRKYHLNSCDFAIEEVKAGGSLHDAYKEAALKAIGEEPHLALTVIRAQHWELPDAINPYYVSKATFMGQGVPVQVVKIEKVRGRNAYILNNIALAMYAKLGGIPWVLASGTGITHEIIVGIGSAVLKKGRRGAGDRVIGITTVFSGDGQYLLANSTKEVSSDEYISALTSSLRETVDYLRQRFAWQPRDRVRFIFHQSFKKYKNVEAEAVKKFAESLTDFEVQYAFVHVSDSHDWLLFDDRSRGFKYGADRMKGVKVPHRARYVPLGPNTALLTLTGPSQISTDLQGCPQPVLINIHQNSTFKSLDYIAQQVFNLSFMSWRSFHPGPQPVSIAYSTMIVDLLSHLRQVKNWNPDALATKLRDRRWFL